MTIAPPERHPATGQPVGAPVDSRPAPRPEPVVLEGRYGRLEKLDAARHGPDLWHGLEGRPDIWTYMANHGPFADDKAFADWLSERASRDDPYVYAIIDLRGRAVGISALMRIEPAMRVVEVGQIVYLPALQKTPLGTEAQYLLARYAFETLGYRRYEWKCDALNAASRSAALRYGFTFEGIFRQHMIAKGRSRDSAWFSILDGEWPTRKAAFERWLEPGNFDREGKQKTSLRTLMAGGA